MNRTTISAIAFAIIAAPTVAMAQTPAAIPVQMEAAKSMAGMDTKGQMAQMDLRINEMQAMHEKMMKAPTPEARRLIAEEQRKLMGESMGVMNHMMPNGGMMDGQGVGMMAGQGGGMMAGQGGGMMAGHGGGMMAGQGGGMMAGQGGGMMAGQCGGMMTGQCGAITSGKAGGEAADKGVSGNTSAQMPMMQRRMDMMQMVMQTMLDQQGMMGGPKGPVTTPKN